MKTNYGEENKIENNFLFSYFYITGNFFMKQIKKIEILLRRRILIILEFSGKQIKYLLKKLYLYFKDIWFDLKKRFVKVKHDFLKDKIKYKDSSISTTSIIPIYFKMLLNFLKVFVYIMNKMLRILVPVASIYIFMIFIDFYSNQKRAIRVDMYNEKENRYIELGYIENENIYQAAQKELQDDIKYQGEEVAVYAAPKFLVTTVKEDTSMLSYVTLRQEIIKASGNDIVEAIGIYVDDEFLGAVQNVDKINKALDDMLEPYKTGEKGEKVEFSQSITTAENIYLKSSEKKEDEIIEALTQKQEKEEVYVVVKGDSPSLVASNLNMNLEDLKSLNPNIDDNFKPGKELVVKTEKNFLSIKRTYKIKYEEKIQYENLVLENKSRSVGYFSIAKTGKDGIAEIEAAVTTVDGVKTSQTEVSRILSTLPVNEEKVVGTRTYVDGKAVNVPLDSVYIGTGQFKWPVQSGGYITCGWGCYRGHNAMDIQSHYGDNTLASDDGVVTDVIYNRYGYGYHVIINHLNGFTTLYAHNSALLVKQGDIVKKGDPIAKQGNTGNVRGRTGIHLHFEIRYNGNPLNPRNYL